MGFVGDAGAEAALSQMTSDGDPSVRRAAESALVRIRVNKQAGTLRPTP
jgi:HEAT repeat protein